MSRKKEIDEDPKVLKWIEKAKKGDQKAIVELYEHCKPLSMALVGKMMLNDSRKTEWFLNPEDFYHIGFAGAILNICSFKGEATIGTFVARCTVNAFLSDRRRRSEIPFSETDLPEERYAPGDLRPVENIVMTRQERRLVRDAISSLKPNQRQIAEGILEGMSPSEINPNVDRNTMYKRAHDTKKRLKGILRRDP